MNLSPLRYPGSKYVFRNSIKHIIETCDLKDSIFYEPFCGGASLSLFLLENKLVNRAVLIENDPMLYSFWKVCSSDPEYLLGRIDKEKVTIETWKKEREYLAVPYSKQNKYELAYACLFLNRTSFSGILNAGPLGGYDQKSEYKIDCRFNKKELKSRILFVNKHSKKMKVVFSDGVNYIKKREDRIISDNGLVYLDPPYYKNGHRLYRKYFKMEDHIRLCKVLQSAEYKWILSYDNSIEILDLYRHYRIMPMEFNYRINSLRNIDELLISNFFFLEENKVDITINNNSIYNYA